MKRLNNYLLAIFTFIFCYSNAQMDWIDFGNNGEGEQPPQLTEINDSTFRVDFFGTYRYKKMGNDTIYDVLKLSGKNGQTVDVGLPELPTKACYIELVVDTPAIFVVSEEYIILENFNIMPAQEILESIDENPHVTFDKNDSLYNSNSFYPSQNIKISHPKILRDHKISTLVFSQFNSTQLLSN
jgi:hypothetical protein